MIEICVQPSLELQYVGLSTPTWVILASVAEGRAAHDLRSRSELSLLEWNLIRWDFYH